MEFLAMFGYQHHELTPQYNLSLRMVPWKWVGFSSATMHNKLPRKALTGGIQHIETQTPECYYLMLKTLSQATESIIKTSPNPCSHSAGAYCSICDAHIEGSCCCGTYMTSQGECLRDIIECPANQHTTLTDVIGRVKGLIRHSRAINTSLSIPV
jgi:hypothetical protein